MNKSADSFYSLHVHHVFCDASVYCMIMFSPLYIALVSDLSLSWKVICFNGSAGSIPLLFSIISIFHFCHFNFLPFLYFYRQVVSNLSMLPEPCAKLAICCISCLLCSFKGGCGSGGRGWVSTVKKEGGPSSGSFNLDVEVSLKMPNPEMPWMHPSECECVKVRLKST